MLERDGHHHLRRSWEKFQNDYCDHGAADECTLHVHLIMAWRDTGGARRPHAYNRTAMAATVIDTAARCPTTGMAKASADALRTSHYGGREEELVMGQAVWSLPAVRIRFHNYVMAPITTAFTVRNGCSSTWRTIHTSSTIWPRRSHHSSARRCSDYRPGKRAPWPGTDRMQNPMKTVLREERPGADAQAAPTIPEAFREAHVLHWQDSRRDIGEVNSELRLTSPGNNSRISFLDD